MCKEQLVEDPVQIVLQIVIVVMVVGAFLLNFLHLQYNQLNMYTNNKKNLSILNQKKSITLLLLVILRNMKKNLFMQALKL